MLYEFGINLVEHSLHIVDMENRNTVPNAIKAYRLRSGTVQSWLQEHFQDTTIKVEVRALPPPSGAATAEYFPRAKRFH